MWETILAKLKDLGAVDGQLIDDITPADKPAKSQLALRVSEEQARAVKEYNGRTIESPQHKEYRVVVTLKGEYYNSKGQQRIAENPSVMLFAVTHNFLSEDSF